MHFNNTYSLETSFHAAWAVTGLMLSQGCSSCHRNPPPTTTTTTTSPPPPEMKAAAKDGMQSLPAVTFFLQASSFFFLYISIFFFSFAFPATVSGGRFPRFMGLRAPIAPLMCSALWPRKKKEKRLALFSSKWILRSFCRRREEEEGPDAPQSSTSSHSLWNSVRLHYIASISTRGGGKRGLAHGS